MLDVLAGHRCSVRSALLYIVAVLQCLISYSAASAAALFVLAAFMVVVRFRGVRPFVNGLSCLGVCGILSLLACAGGVLLAADRGVQGKTLTFAGRTFIWDSVLGLMAGKHLLVGYGSSIQFNIVAQGIPYSDPSPQLPLVSAAERGNYRLRPARNSSVTRHEDALSLLSRLPPRQCLPLRWRAFS